MASVSDAYLKFHLTKLKYVKFYVRSGYAAMGLTKCLEAICMFLELFCFSYMVLVFSILPMGRLKILNPSNLKLKIFIFCKYFSEFERKSF